MRAYEYLLESSCNRTTLQKLCDVVSHPTTEENIKKIALEKAHLLFNNMDEEERSRHMALNDIFEFEIIQPDVKSRITVETNIEEEQLNIPFVTGVTIGEIYDKLCGLEPSPCSIEFLRQGVIRMIVKPPFHDVSKSDYYRSIGDVIPGLRGITSLYREEGDYLFSLSFV
jgi:hypothetical protein